jgi:hypothetical protein
MSSSGAAPAALAPAPIFVHAHVKKFSHAAVADKVSKRLATVPEYGDLLRACRVREDADGATFDATHPSWHLLLHLCAIADTLNKEAAAAASSSSSSPPPPVAVWSRDFPLPPSKLETIEAQRRAILEAEAAAAAAAASATAPPAATGAEPDAPRTGASPPAPAAAAAAPRDASSGTPPQVPAASNGSDDDWVAIKVVKGPVTGSSTSPSLQPSASSSSPPAPSASGGLSAAAASLFSHNTVSRAASALEKLGKIVTARPAPPVPNRPARPAQQPPASSGKSSSNSSRDVQLVRDDLAFEAQLEHEFTSPDEVDTGPNPLPHRDPALLARFLSLVDASRPGPPALSEIKGVCKVLGVPHRHRGKLWACLLGVKGRTAEEAAAGTDAPAAPAASKLRVIRADIERTLPHLLTFQRGSVRADMEWCLLTYCQRHNISYKQGMNYLVR